MCVCEFISLFSMLSSFCRRVSEAEQRNVNNFCSFIHRAPAIQIQLCLPHTHTSAIIKSREGEPKEKRGQTDRRERRERDRQRSRERELCIKCPQSDPSVSRALIIELACHQRGRERKSLRQGQQGQSPLTLTAVLLFMKFATTRILVVQPAHSYSIYAPALVSTSTQRVDS